VAQVVRMVEEAPLYETKIQNHAEKFADRLVAPSLISTLFIFAGTMNIAQLAAMLTVDFGTGVRVAAPTAVLSSMITSASNGILIKGGSYLEKLYHTDTIIFDKTGTLTTGVIHVEDLVSFNGYGNPELLSFAATAEMQMTHPIAEAVVRHAANRNIPLKNRTGVKYVVGRGVQADIEGKQTLVGSLRLMRESGVEIGSSVLERKDNLVAAGKACLYVAIDEKFCGLISFRDQVRKESKQMIEELHRLGVKQVIMLTGDVEQVAKPVCEALGIDKCYAEMLPEEKADVVKDLKEQDHTVAFVGDGINDSVALSYADIGISVKGGADIAKETAGVILLNENLLNIPKAFEISKQTIGLIKESYWIVGSFNVFAYTLAAFGLASPVLTTLISNGSAVVACLNGMKPMIRMKLGAGKKEQPDGALKQQIGKLRLSSGKKDDSPQGVERIPYQQDEGTDPAEILVH
jgi:heavy metal translocating P-type ATPase